MDNTKFSNRKIIHVDMDCFYAAVETRENPRLKGKPVAVGGRPGSRGVVAACNYEARAFGVHSAMPMSQAVKKCPQLIITKVNIPLYKKVSGQIHKIFRKYTQLIQPLSLDEAYLDVTDCDYCKGSATLIARQIRKEIWQQQRLTASAGIAPNKFLAKVASDWNKPNGQFVITPKQVQDFVRGLPVRKIFGVGKVTNKKMQKLGIETCGELQSLSRLELQNHFGKFGVQLYDLARGVDNRPVSIDSIRKSLSIEDTFVVDKTTLQQCLDEVDNLFPALLQRLEKSQNKLKLPIKALYVKVKFNNFQSTTAQMIFHEANKDIYYRLLKTAWQRECLPVRLIGLGIQFDEEKSAIQMDLPFI